MIKLLDVDDFAKGLVPVTSTEYFSRAGEFHPDGLFSEQIFGPVGTSDRREKYSFIELHTKVVHPTAYRIIVDHLDGRVEKFISTEKAYNIVNGALVEDPDGISGLASFIKVFPEIKWRGGTAKRDSFIRFLKQSYEEGTLFINKIPVIPPAFRDAVKTEDNQWEFDPLNDEYLLVMRRAFQVRATKAGPLFDLLCCSLQDAVIKYDSFVRAKIGKKHGVIRGNLLGKRVDFSGRAVITVNPNLKINEVGIPIRMAVLLFEPFIIHHLLYVRKDPRVAELIKKFTGSEMSVDSVKRVLRAIRAGDTIPQELYDIIFEVTSTVAEKRVVLCKRDPVLHPESVRAFQAIVVPGSTLQICSLQVGGFNADFDGDQMAVYHPLTDEAQEEARTRMMGAFTGRTFTDVSFDITKEACVGLYMLSLNVPLEKKAAPHATAEALENAVDPYTPVHFKGRTTSVGKAIINACFPAEFRFVDEVMTKSVVKKLVYEVAEKFGEDAARQTAFNLQKQGFKWATLLAPSISLDSLEVPKEIYVLKQRLAKATPEEATEILKKMKQIITDHLQGSPLYNIVESGGSKGWDQPLQILAAKGVIADPKGNILAPIKSSFTDGLTPSEFFYSASGSRKGIIDRVINTADTGYISRQLVMLLNPVEIHPSLADCKTTTYLNLKLDSSSINRLEGRFVVRRGKIVLFDKNDYKPGDVIQLRSPVYCQSWKICHTCYGRLLLKHRSPFIGVIAAQRIGERGTQLIMRTFHTGGAVSLEKKDILNDIVSNNDLLTKSDISKYLKQEGNTLIASKDCSLTIDLEYYEDGNTLKLDEDSATLWVKSLVSTLTIGDIKIEVILDYEATIFAREFSRTDRFIVLTFKEGESILEVSTEAQDIKKQVLYLRRLLAGKEVFKDVDHLFYRLLKIYSPPVADIDIVHLEVLLSQCLRDSSNPSIPARLMLAKGKYSPALADIKKNIFASGFLQGIAFENVGEAIESGITAPKILQPSIIERIMTGEITPKD